MGFIFGLFLFKYFPRILEDDKIYKYLMFIPGEDANVFLFVVVVFVVLFRLSINGVKLKVQK